jgi:hypothetical protein
VVTSFRAPRSHAVFQLRIASPARAVDAAEDLPFCLNAVTDDPAITVRADRRQRVNRALEAVKRVTLPANDYFEGLVVFVFTNFTCRHTSVTRAAPFVAVFSSSQLAKFMQSKTAAGRIPQRGVPAFVAVEIHQESDNFFRRQQWKCQND